MDTDDFTFGASVWGSEDPKPAAIPPPTGFQDTTDTDDFDDFDTAPSEIPPEGDFDDFDDFGDFGDVDNATVTAGFAESASGFADSFSAPPPGRDWEALSLDPMPTRAELSERVNEIFYPLLPDEIIAPLLNDDPIREAQGYNQILVTLDSRKLLTDLFKTPPPIVPPNWTRSRIRRQHLISLGIPVNLDEMMPHSNGRPLPPLEIITRPMSAPPGTQKPGVDSPSTGAQRPNGKVNLGPKPTLDVEKIQELLALDTDTLTIQSISKIEQYVAEFRAQTANTSNLLTWLLQSRDALQQDSETYNGLIAELVGEAQKIKTSKPGRRGSGLP